MGIDSQRQPQHLAPQQRPLPARHPRQRHDSHPVLDFLAVMDRYQRHVVAGTLQAARLAVENTVVKRDMNAAQDTDFDSHGCR